jgi:hypothetical protein
MPPLPLASFWIGGFEGADHRNGAGVPLDMAAVTGHRRRLDDDYAQLARLGVRTVRESVGWRLSEIAPGRFDFTWMRRCMQAADRHGLQVLWTFMHYGMPDDLHVMAPAFVPRFVAFARAAARALRACEARWPPVVTPVNEIGFLAWALAETDTMAGGPRRADGDAPRTPEGDTLRSGYAVKCRLAEAAIAAMPAIREELPAVRFMHVEPLIHVVPEAGRPELQPLADQIAAYQWQAWDLLCGRLEPQLGGTAAHLDVLGVNHYHSSQWEVPSERRLAWHLGDPRRARLSTLLDTAWKRYCRELVVAETSHFGAGRRQWLDDIGGELQQAIGAGLPLRGACLYPVLDRPDWNDLGHWHRSGLWDAGTGENDGGPEGVPLRRLCAPYARALRRWTRRLAVAACEDPRNERAEGTRCST